MDTTRDILYRGYYLNLSTIADDPIPDGIGQGISGCVVDDFDPDDLDVVQFMEKRAEADGMDAGNPFLGGRRIRMSGTVYGTTRALAYDEMMTLRSILHPVLAQREIPDDHGFLPLYFAIPTNDTANFPSGAREMRALVMPKAFHCPINRDSHGGTDSDALSFIWTAVFEMRDPQFEGETAQDYYLADTVVTTGATATASTDLVNKTSHGLVADDRIYFTTLTGGTGLSKNTPYYVISTGLTTDAFKVSTSPGSTAVNITGDYTDVEFAPFTTYTGTFVNRGTYISPLNMLFEVGPLAGTITISAGGSIATITIPASTGNRIIRFKRDKTITVEENNVEAMKRSWLTFEQATTWPLIPSGSSGYTITVDGTTLEQGAVNPDETSHIWFWEMYA
jgi:hypothetical protein